MPRKGGSALRVGLLVVVAVAVLATAVLLIGERGNLFTRNNHYHILFNNVGGLEPGSPVQLNGVDVGRVTTVTLPPQPKQNDIRVEIAVDQRYAARVRDDSQARLKTVGLLGDKYVELTTGSPELPPIPDGGRIHTAPTTSIDQLLSTGENLMDNVIAISFSLRNILARMERGEGILGRLTVDTPEAQSLIDSVHATVDAMEQIATKIDTGEGPLPRLINDRELAEDVVGSLQRLDRVLAKLEDGEGTLPKLLNDPETAQRIDTTLDNLDRASTGLAAFVEEVESSDGLLQKLLTDEEYARQVSQDVRQVIDRVDRLSQQLTEGDGTVAQLIEDPEVYQALQDILVGINESRVLRWLIRNRQKKGIEVRYQDKVEDGEIPPLPPEGEGPEGQTPEREGGGS